MFVDPNFAHDVLGVERVFQQANRSQLKIRSKDVADGCGLALVDNQLSFFRPVAERRHGPIHMAFFLEAAILSRIRSPVTSRSNWAKDNSTLRVSLPMEVVVLKA